MDAIPEVEPWVASLVFYGYIFVSCELARQIISLFIKQGRLKDVIFEFIGTTQLCACLFEGSLVWKYYGTWAYFASVAFVVFAHCSFKRAAVFSNPNQLIETWMVDKKVNTVKFLILIMAECAAGYASFHLAKTFWRLGMSSDHGERVQDFFCSTDLSVPLANGILYEFLATMVDRLIWLKAEKHLSDTPALLVGSLGVATITVIGVDYTGMYFNPILASSMTFGCQGLTALEHCMVYWLGPVMGWMVGTRLNHSVEAEHLKME